MTPDLRCCVRRDLLASLARRPLANLDHVGDVNEMIVTCIDVRIDLLARLVDRVCEVPPSRLFTGNR